MRLQGMGVFRARRQYDPFILGILNALSNSLSTVLSLSPFEVLKCEWLHLPGCSKCHGAGLPPSSHPARISNPGKPGQRRSAHCPPWTWPVGMAGKPPFPLGDRKSFLLRAHCVVFALVSSHCPRCEVFFVANP